MKQNLKQMFDVCYMRPVSLHNKVSIQWFQIRARGIHKPANSGGAFSESWIFVSCNNLVSNIFSMLFFQYVTSFSTALLGVKYHLTMCNLSMELETI